MFKREEEERRKALPDLTAWETFEKPMEPMNQVGTSEEMMRWRLEYFPKVTDEVWSEVVEGAEGERIRKWMPKLRDVGIWKRLKVASEREAEEYRERCRGTICKVVARRSTNVLSVIVH